MSKAELLPRLPVSGRHLPLQWSLCQGQWLSLQLPGTQLRPRRNDPDWLQHLVSWVIRHISITDSMMHFHCVSLNDMVWSLHRSAIDERQHSYKNPFAYSSVCTLLSIYTIAVAALVRFDISNKRLLYCIVLYCINIDLLPFYIS